MTSGRKVPHQSWLWLLLWMPCSCAGVARLIHFKAMVIILHFTLKMQCFSVSRLVCCDGWRDALPQYIILCFTILHHGISGDVHFNSNPPPPGKESLDHEENADQGRGSLNSRREFYFLRTTALEIWLDPASKFYTIISMPPDFYSQRKFLFFKNKMETPFNFSPLLINFLKVVMLWEWKSEENCYVCTMYNAIGVLWMSSYGQESWKFPISWLRTA